MITLSRWQTEKKTKFSTIHKLILLIFIYPTVGKIWNLTLMYYFTHSLDTYANPNII